MTGKQTAMLSQYNHAWGLLRNDRHFTPEEVAYMQKVYAGLLEESVKNLDQILVVVNAFKTQMSDEKRLELISAAADRMDTNCSDLKQFNNQNFLMSIQRGKTESEVQTLKKYYGVQ
jgi:hypothetical protein